MTITPLPKSRIQQYTAAQPALPPTAQVTQIYLQPGQLVAGSVWVITVIDADGSTHVATYQSAPSDGPTEIINGILAAFNPTPPDDCFNELVVTANYALRFITIVSAEPIAVQASVTAPSDAASKWELVAFPYALAEPVIRGAYSDGLREAGQTDKGMAEEQGAVAEVGDRIGKASATGYDALTDQQRPAPRYRTRARTPAAGGS